MSDFTTYSYGEGAYDWVITNPPFRLAEEFILRAMPIARKGVAVLARTVFIESVGRYRGIFERTPPTKVAQFTERVPMVKGRSSEPTRLVWIPPCRKDLEKEADYTTVIPGVPSRGLRREQVKQEDRLFV